MPGDCCNPCAGARTACVVECDNTSTSTLATPTIAAMRTVPGPYTLYQRLDRLGQDTPYDGLGMSYWFDTTSFDADNGTTVVKPNSINSAAPGRWRQL